MSGAPGHSLLLIDMTFLAYFALASTVAASAVPAPLDDDTDRLRVLVWNIERGANPYAEGAEKALALIREVQPDVCLLQESYDIDGERPELGAWMASELGWNSWQGESPHLCVLTPLSIEERYFHAAWHGVGARLVDDSKRTFDVYSTWIDWKAYLPYALRDDPEITDEALIGCETDGSDRVDQATAIIEHLRATGRTKGEVPLLVGGDWNSPSHLDWTVDTARAFRFKRPLALPVSRLMADAGFVDTFREVHPDPLRTPAFTWTPLERGTTEAPTPLDRIDRLYRMPTRRGEWQLVPVVAHVLPRVHESAELSRADRLFPSDHGAVVIDFAWKRRER